MSNQTTPLHFYTCHKPYNTKQWLANGNQPNTPDIITTKAEELPRQPTNTENNHQEWDQSLNHNNSTDSTSNSSSVTTPGNSFREEGARVSSSNDSWWDFKGTKAAETNTATCPPAEPIPPAPPLAQLAPRYVPPPPPTYDMPINNMLRSSEFAMDGRYYITVAANQSILTTKYLHASVTYVKDGFPISVTISFHDGSLAAILNGTNDSQQQLMIMRIMSAQDSSAMRAAFAAIAVIHGVTCGSMPWTIVSASGQTLNDWVKLPFTIRRSPVSLLDISPQPSWDGHILDPEAAAVLCYGTRGLKNYGFKTTPKNALCINQALWPEEHITYQRPDAVHVQTVAMRLLARDVEQHRNDFRVSAIQWAWGSAETRGRREGAPPRNIVLERDLRPIALQSPVLAFTMDLC
ncbi:Hypothetical protein, putative [Bodo saltans]|uniref:Uncharacterized protein n=1 Tax=Bodo saltans TaxID=75058 RepID=A0A0S4J637_BODSA|nr:Hypothetical protein, putative [Bodo saltans]|eukprot:CUG86643.1 Hypothetical protein, putative [Bodo saltans]